MNQKKNRKKNAERLVYMYPSVVVETVNGDIVAITQGHLDSKDAEALS